MIWDVVLRYYDSTVLWYCGVAGYGGLLGFKTAQDALWFKTKEQRFEHYTQRQLVLYI